MKLKLVKRSELDEFIALESSDWKTIYEFLKLEERTSRIVRNTNETKIDIQLNLDGTGKSTILILELLFLITC